MRRYLAPAFVTTVSIGVLGCPRTTGTASGGPEPTVHGNPPPPPQTKKRRRTAEAKIDWTAAAPRSGSGRQPLNPKDTQGRPIYVDAQDFCAVHLPRTDNTPLPVGAAWWRNESVDCPAELDDPAWDHCTANLVLASDGSCLCEPLTGNPPPPPRLVACPASAKKPTAEAPGADASTSAGAPDAGAPRDKPRTPSLGAADAGPPARLTADPRPINRNPPSPGL